MKIKVVFHIDEVEKWKLLLGNINSLIKGIDIKISEVEILANSNAVTVYKESDSIFKKELTELYNLGVRICACNNALVGMNISKSQIMKFIEVVPIGVKELIERQLDGSAYIKP